MVSYGSVAVWIWLVLKVGCRRYIHIYISLEFIFPVLKDTVDVIDEVRFFKKVAKIFDGHLELSNQILSLKFHI